MNTDNKPSASATLDPASSPCTEMNLPPPTNEHAWLQRFVGEWDLELEMNMGPDQPPMRSKGSDRCSMVGGFWLVSHGRNHAFPYECRLALGFDPQSGRYVGTWFDSMSSYLWHYTGTVDKSGDVLTLETQGPFFPEPGTTSRFREVTEFKSADHRVFTSSRQMPSGEWVPMMRIEFRRKA